MTPGYDTGHHGSLPHRARQKEPGRLLSGNEGRESGVDSQLTEGFEGTDPSVRVFGGQDGGEPVVATVLSHPGKSLHLIFVIIRLPLRATNSTAGRATIPSA